MRACSFHLQTRACQGVKQIWGWGGGFLWALSCVYFLFLYKSTGLVRPFTGHRSETALAPSSRWPPSAATVGLAGTITCPDEVQPGHTCVCCGACSPPTPPHPIPSTRLGFLICYPSGQDLKRPSLGKATPYTIQTLWCGCLRPRTRGFVMGAQAGVPGVCGGTRRSLP